MGMFFLAHGVVLKYLRQHLKMRLHAKYPDFYIENFKFLETLAKFPHGNQWLKLRNSCPGHILSSHHYPHQPASLISFWHKSLLVPTSHENRQNIRTNCWLICKRPWLWEISILILSPSSKDAETPGEPQRNDIDTKTLNVLSQSIRNIIYHRTHFKNCRILFPLAVLCVYYVGNLCCFATWLP